MHFNKGASVTINIKQDSISTRPAYKQIDIKDSKLTSSAKPAKPSSWSKSSSALTSRHFVGYSHQSLSSPSTMSSLNSSMLTSLNSSMLTSLTPCVLWHSASALLSSWMSMSASNIVLNIKA
eukprot:1430526-Amphidinium_carterae.1